MKLVLCSEDQVIWPFLSNSANHLESISLENGRGLCTMLPDPAELLRLVLPVSCSPTSRRRDLTADAAGLLAHVFGAELHLQLIIRVLN